MSVIQITLKSMGDIAGRVLGLPTIVLDRIFMYNAFICRQRYAKQRLDSENFDENEFRQETIARLFWYLCVMNKVAVALQYKEEPSFFSEGDIDITPKPNTDTYELWSKLQGLEYNIMTNSGTKLIPEGWYTIFEDIVNELKESIIYKHYD